MKRLILLITSAFFAFDATSQVTAPDFKFDQTFVACEKKWVVMPPDTALRYPYGFIYVDMQAGFTFDLKGFITVGADGKYIADNSLSKNGAFKYRITPGWPKAALLPAKHFDELNLKPEPDWLKIYYTPVKDSLYYNYRMGWSCNAAGDPGMALSYLDKAYRVNPAHEGVKFELIFAYNALGRFKDAIKLLEDELKNKPADIQLYKELGYAYSGEKNHAKAIEVYGRGLSLFAANVKSDIRGEMALNTAMAYKDLNRPEDYKKWIQLAKEYAPAESLLYKKLVATGF